MLVRARNDIQDYGPVTRLKKDRLYIVYAIEKKTGSNGQDQYAVFPFGISQSKVLQVDIDPLYFDSNLFTTEVDLISKEWITKTVPIANGDTTISSFVEWFDDDFYIRAHDWNLREGDYKISDSKDNPWIHNMTEMLKPVKCYDCTDFAPEKLASCLPAWRAAHLNHLRTGEWSKVPGSTAEPADRVDQLPEEIEIDESPIEISSALTSPVKTL